VINRVTHSPTPHPLRTAIIWVARTAVSVGLLYYLARHVDTSQVLDHLRHASVSWLIVALLLYAAVAGISTWRWRTLLHAQHVAIDFKELLASFLVATYFNNFLPSNIGGEVVRITDTARRAGSKTLATTVVFIDRGIGLLGLLFVAAVGSTIVAYRSAAIGPLGPGILWMLFGGGVIGAAPFVLAPERVGKMLAPIRILHQEWVDERLGKFTSALAKFKASPSALIAAFGGAVVIQAILIGFYAAIARALQIQIPWNHLGILVPVSFVVQMLPVSIGGLGVREGLFKQYFAGLGLNPGQGIILSLMGFALMIVFSISGAVIYLMRRR